VTGERGMTKDGGTKITRVEEGIYEVVYGNMERGWRRRGRGEVGGGRGRKWKR